VFVKKVVKIEKTLYKPFVVLILLTQALKGKNKNQTKNFLWFKAHTTTTIYI